MAYVRGGFPNVAANCHLSAILHLLADSLFGIQLVRGSYESLAAPGAGVVGSQGIAMKALGALLAHSLGLCPMEEAGMTRCLRQLMFLAGIEAGVFQDADETLRAVLRMAPEELRGTFVSNWSSVQKRRCGVTSEVSSCETVVVVAVGAEESLGDALERFGREEDTRVDCPQCGPREAATTEMRLNAGPSDLVVTAKRWCPLTRTHIRGSVGPIGNVVLRTKEAVTTYRPVGCVRFDRGHYVYSDLGLKVLCDDERVTKWDGESPKGGAPYVLLFRKCGVEELSKGSLGSMAMNVDLNGEDTEKKGENELRPERQLVSGGSEAEPALREAPAMHAEDCEGASVHGGGNREQPTSPSARPARGTGDKTPVPQTEGEGGAVLLSSERQDPAHTAEDVHDDQLILDKEKDALRVAEGGGKAGAELTKSAGVGKDKREREGGSHSRGAERSRTPKRISADDSLECSKAPRPTLAFTDPGSVMRRSRKPAKSFSRMFRGLDEKQQRILGSYLKEKGVEVDQEDGRKEMPSVNNTVVFGSDRLSANFWRTHPLKDYPTLKEYRGLGPTSTAYKCSQCRGYIPLTGDHMAAGNISRWTKHATFKHTGVRFIRTPTGVGFSENPDNLGQWTRVEDGTEEKRALEGVKEMVRRDQLTLFATGTDHPPAIPNAKRWEKKRLEGLQGAEGGRGVRPQ